MINLKLPVLALNIFFVFGAFGATAMAEMKSALARADPKQSSLQDLMWGQVALELSLSQGVPYRLYTRAQPDRIVLEFNKALLENFDEAEFNQSDRISSIDFGVSETGWDQLLLYLDQPLTIFSAEMKIPPDASGAILKLVLAPVTREEFIAIVAEETVKQRPVSVQTYSLTETKKAHEKLRVVIDPGHGGIDPGAQIQGIDEADLMLSLARDIKETLLRSMEFEVSLTRVDDSFVSLEERVRLANSAEADIFLSLHADAVTEGVARGATVYTLSENATDAASAALAARHNRDELIAGVDLTGTDEAVTDVLIDLARLDNAPRSRDLALSVIAGLEKALGQVNSKPYRQAGFSVLKAADIPSVLIEAGFMSTDTDLQNLQNQEWRLRFAEGVRIGILEWAMKDQSLKTLRRK